MAETTTQSPKNRVFLTFDVGGYSMGRKIGAFIGGDTVEQVLTDAAALFGQQATDEAIGKLLDMISTDTTATAVSNAQAGGLVGGQSSTPASNAPVCNHGARVYRESKPGAAKQWKAWFCPTAQGTPDQCKPEFLK